MVGLEKKSQDCEVREIWCKRAGTAQDHNEEGSLWWYRRWLNNNIRWVLNRQQTRFHLLASTKGHKATA